MFWTGRDKLDSLFVTCISSFMFAFDSFLTWPMVPLKQKPENGNYFTLAMWRSRFSIIDGLESTDQIKRLSNFTNINADCTEWKIEIFLKIELTLLSMLFQSLDFEQRKSLCSKSYNCSFDQDNDRNIGFGWYIAIKMKPLHDVDTLANLYLN